MVPTSDQNQNKIRLSSNSQLAYTNAHVLKHYNETQGRTSFTRFVQTSVVTMAEWIEASRRA